MSSDLVNELFHLIHIRFTLSLIPYFHDTVSKLLVKICETIVLTYKKTNNGRTILTNFKKDYSFVQKYTRGYSFVQNTPFRSNISMGLIIVFFHDSRVQSAT